MKIFAVALLAACLAAPACFASEETFTFAPFGTVTVYRPTPHPKHVALFLSGDGGWKLGVVDMAREIAGMDTLVAGVSLPAYMKAVGAEGKETAAADPNVCFNPSGDLEALGRAVETRYGYAARVPPILVGYSSGATLVYAALVQAPPRTFGGAVSLGFCPDLIVNMPICKGNGLAWKRDKEGKGVDFLPSKLLEAPWVALQGDIDQVCTPEDTRTYVNEVPHGELVWLHKVGHGFSVPKNWMRQFKESFERVATGERPERDEQSSAASRSSAGSSDASPAAKPPAKASSGGRRAKHRAPAHAASPPARLARLPLIEVPAHPPAGGRIAVLLTGDGGWRACDRDLAKALAARGIPVVGWSSLRYFLRGRSPAEGARDLEAVLGHYLAAWQADEAIVIGYSFGADVVPFFVNRLPRSLRARIPLVALIGPDRRADFRLRLADLLGRDGKDSVPVVPEIQKLRGTPILCSYGERETWSLCPELPADLARVVQRPGGHKLARGGPLVARHILDALGRVDLASTAAPAAAY
ncbi:MAG TPA: AcvB/VirJ family lysyl-phosphatidylglycerol hydrolase [Thermoanaerobaculia bacterium]|jgi:type IV secretory pathway VirJ component